MRKRELSGDGQGSCKRHLQYLSAFCLLRASSLAVALLTCASFLNRYSLLRLAVEGTLKRMPGAS